MKTLSILFLLMAIVLATVGIYYLVSGWNEFYGTISTGSAYSNFYQLDKLSLGRTLWVLGWLGIVASSVSAVISYIFSCIKSPSSASTKEGIA